MDLTSWWPRPKSEGITEELARLQAGAEPAAPGTPPGIRAGGSFPQAHRKGYDAVQVDAFLARAATLSAREIREVQFATARKAGYDMAAVDAELDRLEREAAAREREA